VRRPALHPRNTPNNNNKTAAERPTAVAFVPATRGTLRLQNRPQTFLAFAICGAFALRADWMTQLSISCHDLL
jgi:hypothetical protein